MNSQYVFFQGFQKIKDGILLCIGIRSLIPLKSYALAHSNGVSKTPFKNTLFPSIRTLPFHLQPPLALLQTERLTPKYPLLLVLFFRLVALGITKPTMGDLQIYFTFEKTDTRISNRVRHDALQPSIAPLLHPHCHLLRTRLLAKIQWHSHCHCP